MLAGGRIVLGWKTLCRSFLPWRTSQSAEKPPTVIPATTSAATKDEVVDDWTSALVADMANKDGWARGEVSR